MPEKYIVDGYNVIFASQSLGKLARQNLEAARDKFISKLETFSGEKEVDLEVVFDAGKTEDPANSVKRSGFLTVTYTAPGQTADSYIEREAYKAKEREVGEVVVVTGDYLQQKIVMGTGSLRVTPNEFLADVEDSLNRFEADLVLCRRKPWRVRLERRISENERKILEKFHRKD